MAKQREAAAEESARQQSQASVIAASVEEQVGCAGVVGIKIAPSAAYKRSF